MTGFCLDCSRPLSRQNRFGRCRGCTAAALARDPAARAKTVAKMKRNWKDPAYKARVSRAISNAKVRRIARDPDYAEMMRRKGADLAKTGKGLAAQDTPEFRERQARTMSDVRLPWCPPEWRDRYRAFRKRGISVIDAKARTLDLIPPFEIQLWKVRRGCGLVNVNPIRAAGPAYSLTGNGSAACAEAAI